MKNWEIAFVFRRMTAKLVSVCGNKISAEQEAWWILQHVTGKNRTGLLADSAFALSDLQFEKVCNFVDQRVSQNKPLAYLFGFVPFCDLDILVEPPILIPRPETEEWVCWLISDLKSKNIKNFKVLDLCSGSGCIGLAIAKSFSEADVVCVDISAQAVKIGNLNKAKNKLENIEFIESNMFEQLKKNMKFDLIVCNPPYLSSDEYGLLDDDVKLWEDKNALVADCFGMWFYNEILLNAQHFLTDRFSAAPKIVFEIGPSQKSIEILLQNLHYNYFKVHNDMQGKRRWISIYSRNGCW